VVTQQPNARILLAGARPSKKASIAASLAKIAPIEQRSRANADILVVRLRRSRCLRLVLPKNASNDEMIQ